MSYANENNQNAAAELVLQTTENSFIASKSLESPVNVQLATEVYFQIED